MKRFALLALVAWPLLTAGSCATTGQTKLEVQTVHVPTPVPCPDKRAPAPAYADSAADLKALPDAVERVKRVMAANTLLHERTQEDDAQIAACATTPGGGAVPPR